MPDKMTPEDPNNNNTLKFIREINSEIQKQLKKRGVPSRLHVPPANPSGTPNRYTDFTIQKSFEKKKTN